MLPTIPVKKPALALGSLHLLGRRAASDTAQCGNTRRITTGGLSTTSTAPQRLRNASTLEGPERVAAKTLGTNLGCFEAVLNGGKLGFETMCKLAKLYS